MHTDFTKILLDFKSIPIHKQTKTFMEISGYPHYENVCSNILKFYLDPKNEHGLDNLVLNSLLHLIDEDFRFDSDYEQIEIHREHRTINDNRLDLLILTDNYSIGIENKIFHHLHNDLCDYKDTVNLSCTDSRKPVYIVLSLNKLTSKEDMDKVSENGFVNVTYEQLFANIKRNIGKHLNNSNIGYINHLTDFIKSIENLTSRTMENRVLWTFFKNNAETIQELIGGFNKYKESLNLKIQQLSDALPPSEFAPKVSRQWIYNSCCLVHDYTINSKYKLAVDTYIDINGWEIQLFGRNIQSTDFIFNVMCKDNDFLPKPLESYEIGKRIIYQRFDTDADITIVAETLADLLTRIEKYKEKIEVVNQVAI